MPILLSVLSIGPTITCKVEGSVSVKVKTCVERGGIWVGVLGMRASLGKEGGGSGLGKGPSTTFMSWRRTFIPSIHLSVELVKQTQHIPEQLHRQL